MNENASSVYVPFKTKHSGTGVFVCSPKHVLDKRHRDLQRFSDINQLINFNLSLTHTTQLGAKQNGSML